MIWGIIDTVFILTGFGVGIYMFCGRKRNNYTQIPATSPIEMTTMLSSPFLTPSPSINPTPHRLPNVPVPSINPTPRLPSVQVTVEDEDEDEEPIDKRTRSATNSCIKEMKNCKNKMEIFVGKPIMFELEV